ncbi:hypothetical protein [Streptomyces sp. NPDC005244]|uniref:hypothetical protein n=1 Tax=Streptomyces sp. NPDC005244 TaxID=3364708 RepID=UPI003691129B
MTPEASSLADRETSALLDADFDAVRIAAALLNSPHLLTASAEPGDDVVRFTSRDGIGYTLALESAEPDEDDLLPAPVLTEAVAAAILNSPHFVAAAADSPREDTIAVQTRDQARHLLVVDIDRSAGNGHTPAAPVADIASAADQLLTSAPSESERATAELLHHIAETWDRQDRPLRQHAQTLARALSQGRAL